MIGVFIKTESQKRFSSHLLVSLQVVFLVMCCYPVGLINSGPVWFLLLCAVGAVLGIVVLYFNPPSNFGVYPEVRVGAKLITQGPYKYVRHPMYAALIIMMVGIAGYNGHWLNYIGTGGILLVVLLKVLREEVLLPQVFPEYEAYQSRTARLVPFIW